MEVNIVLPHFLLSIYTYMINPYNYYVSIVYRCCISDITLFEVFSVS